MSLRRALRLLFRGVLGACAGVVCVAVVAVGVAAIQGYRPIVITTGSMGESAPPGSLVVARPDTSVEVGDVLVMRTDGRATVTHRVVDLAEQPTGMVAVTRGDANPDIDPVPYRLGEEELTARWVVPNAGDWLLSIRSPIIGLTLLIGVVGGLVFLALRRIWKPGESLVPPEPGWIPPPPPPPTPQRVLVARRRKQTAAALVATGAFAVTGTIVYALYTGVDSVAANAFSTRPCFDARLGSVQTGQHTNDTAGTDVVPITVVDPSRSFLLMSTSSDSDEPDESMVAGRLASANTIEFVRNTNDTPPADIVIEWSVVEYDCGVSVQRGTEFFDGVASQIDVPISSVEPSSSFALLSQGTEAGSGAFGGADTAAIELTGPTNLRITAGSPPNVASPFSWQVITFDGADVVTQQIAASVTGTDSVVNVPIPTTVTPTSTAVFVSARYESPGINIGDRTLRARLVDGDTVELSRSVVNGELEVVVQVVEFADGTTVRHGVIDLAGSESVGTVSIPPVQPSRSTVTSSAMLGGGLGGGSTAHLVDDTVGEASGRFVLLDERTVEVRRDSTTSEASFAWQVITWNGPNWADLDAPFRRRIDVGAGSVVTPTGYTTPLTFDHASFVTGGLSLSDGSDLRVWRHDGVSWTELDRVLDDDTVWNAADTTFWFRTQEAIAADDTVSYWLYFGDDTPAPPLEDPSNVWLAVEGFDDGTLGIFEDRTGGTAWYDDDPWTRRIVIDIDGTGLAAPVVDAAVPVRVTDTDLTANLQADADDVRFTAADGTTVLAHQIETWDPGSDTLTAWVRVPNVAAGGTTQIHLYYGSAGAPDQAEPRALWADDRAAWLLAADPATDHPALDDESVGQRDGVALGDTAAAATTEGAGASLDGSLDRLESQPFVTPDAPFTASVWFRADTIASDAVLMSQGDPAAGGVFEIRVEPTGIPEATVAIGGTPLNLFGGTITTSGWHHVTLTWDRSDVRLHVDGTEVATLPASGSLVQPGPIPVVLGGDAAGSTTLDGTIGHAQISDSAWTAEHIELTASALLSPGATVSGGSPSGGTWFEQGTWSTRWPVVVDADRVAGPLTDYPLLVRLTDAALGSAAQVDGDDLVVTAADGVSRLDHHIESWNAGTGDLTAWVRIPTLDDSSDTTIFLYAGNGTAIDQSDAQGVWGDDADLILGTG